MMLRVTRIRSFLSTTLSKIGVCPLLVVVVVVVVGCSNLLVTKVAFIFHVRVTPRCCRQEHPSTKVLDGSLWQGRVVAESVRMLRLVVDPRCSPNRNCGVCSGRVRLMLS